MSDDLDLREIVHRMRILSRQMSWLVEEMLKLKQQENRVMVTLAEIQTKANDTLAKVTAETDVVNAVKMVVDHQNADIAALKQQVVDLIASGGADAAALQTLADTLDSIQSAETANAAIVAAAVAAGTPATP